MTYQPNAFAGALCADSDPEIWFDAELEYAAKRICGECPAQEACFEFAMAGGEGTSYGVWGGVTAEGRDNMRRYGIVTLPGIASRSYQAKFSA